MDDWLQQRFDVPDAVHVDGEPVQDDGTPYPADWPVDEESGRLSGWNGLIWRRRPYTEIDPGNVNNVAGIAPSRTHNVSTPGKWSLYGRKADAVRSSAWMDVPEGQYEIRIRRTTADTENDRDVSRFSLLQLKSVQPDKADYAGQKRMAVRIKATSQLNGSIANLAAVVSSQIPVWNGKGWALAATSNPAWWYLWWLRGLRDADGRRVYGAGYADEEIDIAGIIRWAGFCAAHDLTSNLVIDKSRSVFNVQQAIAGCGRASPTSQTGKHGVVWAEANRPRVGMITPSNILSGSFGVDWLSGSDLADEIIVSYIDTTTWEPAQVRVMVPGVTQIRNSTTVEYEGCTSLAMATKHANLLAAAQVLHRRRVSWKQDIEGRIVRRGDVVQASHDMTKWDYSGRLIGGDRNTLLLDSPIPQIEAGGWVMLRFPDTRLHTFRVLGGEGETSTLTLTSPIPLADTDGDLPAPDQVNPLDFVWMYSAASATPGVRLMVLDVQPDGDGGATFTAIDDAAEYYDAASNPGEVLNAPTLTDRVFRVQSLGMTKRGYNVTTDRFDMVIRWVLNKSCPVDIAVWIDDIAVPVAMATGSASITAKAGDKVKITATPKPDVLAGVESKTRYYTIIEQDRPMPDVTGLALEQAFVGQSAKWIWAQSANATGYRVEILAEDAVKRTVVLGAVTRYEYAAADAAQDGGPWRTVTLRIKAIYPVGESANWATLSASNPAPPVVTGLRARTGFGSIEVSFDPSTATDVAGYLVFLSEEMVGGPTLGNLVSDNTALSATIFYNQAGEPLEVGKNYYLWVAAYDVFGRDDLNYSGAFGVTMTAIPSEFIKLNKLGMGSFTADVASALAHAAALDPKELDAVKDAAGLVAQVAKDAELAAETQLYALLAQHTETEVRKTETTSVRTEVKGIESKTDLVLARVGEAEASIIETQRVVAGVDYALVEETRNRVAEVGEAKASITETNRVIATLGSALVEETRVREATFGEVKASITETNLAVASQGSALVQRIEAAEAKTGNAEAKANQALTLYTDPTSALSQQLSSLNTKVGENKSAISTVVESVNGVKARAAIVFDVNGHLSGVQLIADGPVSNFTVRADSFDFYTPNGVLPVFVAGEVDEVPTFGINGNLFVDGSIYARHLTVDAIEAARINMVHAQGGRLFSADGHNAVDFSATGIANVLWLGDGAAFIRADGYAEFANAKVRGDIQATSLQAGSVMVGTEHLHPSSVTNTWAVDGDGMGCSITLTTSGGPLVIIAAMVSGQAFEFHLSRDSTDLYAYFISGGMHSRPLREALPAGTYTYRVYPMVAPSLASSLVIMELKR